MRALTVAADGGGVDPAQGSLIAGAAAVIGAAIGGICLWLAQRLVGKAAWETALNAKFAELLKRTEEFHARKEADWAAERLQLRGEIVNLHQTVASLKAALRRAGVVDIPDDKYGRDPLITIAPEDET